MTRLAVLFAAVICTLMLPAAAAAVAPAAHQIRVRIEPDAHYLEGRDSIRFDAPRAATLVLSARFRVDSLVVDGQRIEVAGKLAGTFQRITLPPARRIDLRCSGKLAPLEQNLDHRGTLTYSDPASSKEGTYLPSGSWWYPAVDASIERYSL